MATVDKNFKVKNGLIVEGTTATVNGEDVITTGSTTDDLAQGTTNKYYSTTQAKSDAADLLTGANLTNITITGDENGLTITAENGGIQDLTGFDTDDLTEGATNKYYSDTLVDNHLTGGDGISYSSGTISAALTTGGGLEFGINTEQGIKIDRDVTDNWYDAAGAAATAQSAAEDYADNLINDASNSSTEVWSAYKTSTEIGLAESDANTYTDTALVNYTTTANLDTTIDGYGYLKSADLSGYATETYVGTAIDNLVDGAPGLLDTLNEIAAAINDDANYATTMTTALAGKQNSLTAGSGISISSDTVSVNYNTGLELDGFGKLAVDTDTIATKTYVDGLATNYDAAGTASGLVDDVTDGTTAFTAVNLNSVAQTVAATTTVATAGTAVVHSFSYESQGYRTAEYTIKVATSTHTEVSKILLTVEPGSLNIAITEYGIVSTNGALATLTADINGTSKSVELKATTLNNGTTVTVVGTLIK